LLSGCGVKEEKHQRVVSELQQAKAELEQLKISATKAASDLVTARSKNSELEQRIAFLEKQDNYVFAEIGKLTDGGNYQSALRAYQSFVRDFSGSSRIAEANAQIFQLQQTIQRIEHERLAKDARDRAEIAERQRREALANLRYVYVKCPRCEKSYEETRCKNCGTSGAFYRINNDQIKCGRCEGYSFSVSKGCPACGASISVRLMSVEQPR